jgi:hypothetical protein
VDPVAGAAGRRALGQLLSAYAEQTTSYPALSLNAPSIYQFLPAGADAAVIRLIGVAVTGLVVLGLCLGVLLSRVRLMKPSDFDRTEQWFREHGTRAVFFGRMVPLFRGHPPVHRRVQ